MGVGGEKRVRIHLLLREVFANHLMITRPRVVLMALVTTQVGFFLGSSAKPIDNNSIPVIQVWRIGR